MEDAAGIQWVAVKDASNHSTMHRAVHILQRTQQITKPETPTGTTLRNTLTWMLVPGSVNRDLRISRINTTSKPVGNSAPT